ncbi:hypothetical protein FA13DRAFT_1716237 [Coprinellus micaceus]|uniref:WD40 repeat-like protein n=1 Tax=Coprinellus micaceus TaxID=71717 RepID=A0A4Y7SK00_COPMI|nr:hypothetical protein FA13DRAFT_1716237 [Coprinellus micaceus]
MTKLRAGPFQSKALVPCSRTMSFSTDPPLALVWNGTLFLSEEYIWAKILRAYMRRKGTFVVSSSIDKMTVEQLRRTAGQSYSLRPIYHLVPGGRFLVTGKVDHKASVRLWDLGSPLERVPPTQSFWPFTTSCMDFPTRITALYESRETYAWLEKPSYGLSRPIPTLQSHSLLNLASALVLSVSLDAQIKLFKPLGTVRYAAEGVTRVLISECHVLLLLGNGQALLWNYQDNQASVCNKSSNATPGADQSGAFRLLRVSIDHAHNSVTFDLLDFVGQETSRCKRYQVTLTKDACAKIHGTIEELGVAYLPSFRFLPEPGPFSTDLRMLIPDREAGEKEFGMHTFDVAPCGSPQTSHVRPLVRGDDLGVGFPIASCEYSGRVIFQEEAGSGGEKDFCADYLRERVPSIPDPPSSSHVPLLRRLFSRSLPVK